MKEKLVAIRNTALAAAAIFLVTLFTGRLFALPDGAYIHAGDALIYLAAAFMPLPQALIAAAAGCAAADAAMHSGYMLATIVIKLLTVLAVKGLMRITVKQPAQDLLICLAGAATVLGYAAARPLLGLPIADGLDFDLLQALACAALFLLSAGAVRRLTAKSREKALAPNDEITEESQDDEI